MRFSGLILLVLSLACSAAAGCSGSTPAPVEGPQVNSTIIKAQEPDSTALFPIPAPSQLGFSKAGSKQVSYKEEDVVKDASDNNPAWPWQNIAPNASQVVFSPAWTAPDMCHANGLAYCMYDFSIPGYNRNSQVRYTWDLPLADPSEGWIGLADWGNDTWDWWQCSLDGELNLRSLDSYFDASGNLALVVLRIGTAPSTLNEVRIGGIPPTAEMTTHLTKGLIPLSPGFDGSGSQDDDGQIVKYEWDFDGDGIFETNSGVDPYPDYTYTETTIAMVTMRITDDDGLKATDNVMITALAPWTHTWGDSDTETIRDFVQTSTALYCVGYSESFVGSNSQSLILLKYTLDGELAWAKAFRGTTVEIGDAIAVNPDGDIIVAGRTSSWGSSGDMLVQKWSPEGSLLWSRVYGGSGAEVTYAMALDGSDIYLAGFTSTESYSAGQQDALFVKINTDGNAQWATTWGGDSQDYARDIKKAPSFGGELAFRITGDTRSFGNGGSDAIYLTVTGSGYVTEEYTWGENGDEVGYTIDPGGLGTVPYICGYTTRATNRKAMLLQFSINETFNRKYWNRSGISEAKDLVYTGGSFYVAGTYKVDSGAIAKGFLMNISDSNWVMHSSHYSNPTENVDFSRLTLFGNGQGAFLGGSMDDANGMFTDAYSDPAADMTDYPWVEADGTVNFISIGTGNTSGAAIDTITDAVIDSGGGGKDGAIMLVDLD